MPRVEDIAWKFVIRSQGKKWRCPYCHKETSGSVTRVKGHFLKQPKGGIASCTKVPGHIRTLMELLNNHQVLNKEDIAWKFVDRLEDNKWRCHHCMKEFFGDLTGVKGHLLGVPNERISICTQVPDHIRTLMRSLLDEEAEEESREVAEKQSGEAHRQSFMEQKSRDMLTQSQVAEDGSGDDNCQLSMEPVSRDMPLLVQSSHASVPPQGQSLPHLSINHETRDTQQNATILLDNLDTTQQPDLYDSAPEHFIESRDVIVNSPEEIQTNEQHNPTVGSSLQDDLSLDVDSTNRLQDCSRLCIVEVVPPLSDTSPINAVQHPDQLDPRCDKEDGNDNCLFPMQTPVDRDPSIAPQHKIDSHIIEATIDSQVPEVAANTTGPLSLQDVNRGSPIMDVQIIYANNEEIRNLKRKAEELKDKEAVIKEQRILVERWLKETEKAKNNIQLIGQAHAETLPPKEQVETLTREVEELIKQTLPQTLLEEERDAKGVKFLTRKLIGEAICRNIELIWDYLTKNHACKLGIYGMGGVGKTTIMMHIHNRLLQDATFDGVVFITMSQDVNIYKLQSDIGKALNFAIREDEHEQKRAAMLSEHLERKKNCVLILDDVWEHLDLEEVGIPVRANGLKLVLTTRSFDVCCQMQCQKKIKIEPLSKNEAESLFWEELGSEVTHNLEIEAIVRSIVKECAGLPLGLITMARSMRGVTGAFEWRDSLVKLKESSMGQTNMMEKVLMNLKFSYDRLDNPDVQQCFLSCALYPEDGFLDKFELVEFFIDQGLIGGFYTRMEQYDRGLTILNKLGNVCLLEDHESKVKMHDLIRDMALYIMGATSIVKAGKGLRRIPPEEYWMDALEKVSLMENKICEFSLNMSPNCPKLSTLLLNGGLLDGVVIPDSFFEQLRGLKVLNLSGCGLRELPNSISDLVNLRALLLSKCSKLCRIPYIGKLTSLRKLDASGCESLEALEGLEKLVNLRYLDLTKTRIERLPKGTLDHLLNLQCLKVSAANEEDITKLGALETFRCYLENADDFNKYVRVIEQSNNPQYYNLEVGLEKSEFIVEISDDARFGNLDRRVHVWEWGHAIVSVGGESTAIFILIPRDVKTMTMTNCDGITNLSSMGPLEFLEELKIEGCENLQLLCGGHDEEVMDIHDFPAAAPIPVLFRNLRVLGIYKCPKLKYLLGHGFKFDLPHLWRIIISECEEMVGIIAAVTSPPPPYLLPAFPSLKEIEAGLCDEMKRVVESEWMPHFPNLRSIAVHRCEKMEEIIGGPPPQVPFEGISLESVHICRCNNMRKLFLHEWLLHLRNLRRIDVVDCKGMVEMISGPGQGQEGSMMTPVNNTPLCSQPFSISLPKLKLLHLYKLPQLKSILEVPICCDSMEELVVYRCPKLKGIRLQLRLREELGYIWMEDEQLKTLMREHADVQPYLRKGEHIDDGIFCTWARPCPPNAKELSAKGKDPPQLCS